MSPAAGALLCGAGHVSPPVLAGAVPGARSGARGGPTRRATAGAHAVSSSRHAITGGASSLAKGTALGLVRRQAGPFTVRAVGPEDEIAVFRFTLGIPGLDDAQIPRLVGALGLTLLAINHALVGSGISPGQERTELVASVMAGICVAVPSIGSRLREATSGRSDASEPVAGAREVFKIADGVSDDTKKELAWSSFALLRNTNSRGLLVVKDGAVVLARGALKLPTTDVDALLRALSEAAEPAVQAVAGGAPLYLPDKGAIRQQGAGGWGFVPEGAASLALQPLGTGGVIAVLGDRPRALSRPERRWLAALGDKLSAAM